MRKMLLMVVVVMMVAGSVSAATTKVTAKGFGTYSTTCYFMPGRYEANIFQPDKAGMRAYAITPKLGLKNYSTAVMAATSDVVQVKCVNTGTNAEIPAMFAFDSNAYFPVSNAFFNLR